MKIISQTQIDDFLKSKSMVLFGVSTSKHKFGNSIFKELINKGFPIFAIHKSIKEIDNQLVYSDLNQIPIKPESAIICTKIENSATLLEQLKNYGVKNIWMQQGSANTELINKYESQFENFIANKCIIMFANQSGIHKFHASLLRIFGKFPR